MLGMIGGLQYQARAAARAAGFTFVGIILVLIGSGFLSAALWMVIEVDYGAITATALIGGLYVLLAGLCFLFANIRPRVRVPVAPVAGVPSPSPSPFAAIAEGFAIGMQAGGAARTPKQ